MRRRRTSDDIEFGSDSFLDVVANIVGILIILIVVAGIKAGAAPASAEKIVDYLRKHPALMTPTKGTQTGTSHSGSPPAENSPQVIPPSTDLVRRSQELKSHLTQLDAMASGSTAKERAAVQEEAAADRQIADLTRALESQSAGIGAEKRQCAEAEGLLEKQKQALIQLEVDVQSAEKQKATVKSLRHHVTPLGHEIEGKELHFRLSGGRVAYLPIDEMMQRVRVEMAHQRSRLFREGIVHGEVGPFAGFRMVYTLAVETSVLDELRRGGQPTAGLREWRFDPEPDLAGEAIDEALREGSEFLRRLRDADADTTITFWVYPDSFALYRRLQQFAHDQNMTVAARPLPFGIPIAGSPQGSRSSGQ